MTLVGRNAGRAPRRAWGALVLTLAAGLATAGARGDDGPTARPASSRAAVPAASATGPRADAGDDQIGLVGRRITLNAGSSTPRDATFKWFLLSGPKVDEPTQDGCYYSFTPASAGTYRFGLVVAACRGDVAVVSDIDEVIVTVGEGPAGVLGGGGVPGATTLAIDRMLQGPGAAAGRATLEQAAGAFESVAARTPLYASFSDLSAELMRRLDVVIPADPNWRRYWSEGVFAPLTDHVVVQMRREGLDLSSPQGRDQPLGRAHQEQLQRLLASYAQEFRARAR